MSKELLDSPGDKVDEEDEDGEEDSSSRLFDAADDKPIPPKDKPPMPPPPIDVPPPEKLPPEKEKKDAYEIVDEKSEAKKDQAIKDVAAAIKEGKFDEKAKQMLLDSLNKGENEGDRRKSLTDVINKINQELIAIYKQEKVTDPAKQFQIRTLEVRNGEGNRDSIKIGLQNRRSASYNDSFTVRLKK